MTSIRQCDPLGTPDRCSSTSVPHCFFLSSTYPLMPVSGFSAAIRSTSTSPDGAPDGGADTDGEAGAAGVDAASCGPKGSRKPPNRTPTASSRQAAAASG